MISSKSGQLLAIGIACASAFGIYAFSKYQNHSAVSQKEKEFEVVQTLNEAENLLKKSHPLQALKLLSSKSEESHEYPLLELRLKNLTMASVESIGEDALLFRLASIDPSLIKDNEDLSVRVAAYALSQYDLNSYHSISKEWLAKGTTSDWRLLEADAYAFNGNPDKAIALLESAPLQGDREVKRLVRLALLNENEHPKISWEYLSKALALAPEQSDLHLYRAEILESTGKNNLAAIEYKTAVGKTPSNPFYKEELIDFYIRNQQLPEAVKLLQSSLKSHASDKLWLRAVFLSKVFQPSKIELANESIPEAVTTPFLRYLLALPPTEFWNDFLLTSQPSVEKIAEQIPEAQWLNLFEQLKLGFDTAAYETLLNHPEMAELNYPLYSSLQKAIAFRHPHLHLPYPKVSEKSQIGHPVFAILNSPEIPKSYTALLEGRDSYAALVMASGWYEAALNLQNWYPGKSLSFVEISTEYPRWVAFGFAKALMANRTPEEALAFIKMQSLTPQLSLLAGELSLQLKQYQAAEKVLSPFSKATNPLGVKAALLLSQVHNQKGNFFQARDVITNNSELQKSIAGKEMLARLELTHGDPYLAEKMYEAIGEESTEAKSFFAKKAFKIGDYNKAYKITKMLADQYPDREDLKHQLNQIAQAAAGRS